MTCIVAIVNEDGDIYMGGDSAGVCGYDMRIREDPKVFIRDGFIFGFAGSFRMGQLLRYNLVVPKQECDDDYKYMCTDFIEAVRKCFQDNGFIEKDIGGESGGVFIVGYKGKLYKIMDNFQVACYTDEYITCGCGEDYALGALEILLNHHSYREKYNIELALDVSEKFSAGVRSPFLILAIDKEGNPIDLISGRY